MLLHYISRVRYIQYTRPMPLLVQARYSILCPVRSSSGYNGSSVTWTVVCLTAAKLKPLYGLRICPILQTWAFSWFWISACCLRNLPYNRTRTDCEKAYAYHEPTCSLENCQWCGRLVVGRPSWREHESVIYSYNLLSLSGPSPAELVITCLVWDYRVPLLSPLTRRAAVEVF
jgi:hypothetical protein